MTRALWCTLACAVVAACTYDVHVDHAVEDLQFVYSPCAADAGVHDASGQ